MIFEVIYFLHCIRETTFIFSEMFRKPGKDTKVSKLVSQDFMV